MDEPVSLFRGKAPIFALPSTVFFPGTLLPLHVFEPRYREMTKAALAGDRLIAVALLRPGWEPLYEGNPPIHEICTVGHIVADQALDDGRYNILLEGIARFQPQSLVQESPYRIAKGKLIVDQVDPVTEARVTSQALHLFAVLSRLAEEDPDFAPVYGQLQKSSPAPGRMADIVASNLKAEAALKQKLLEAVDVDVRLAALLHAAIGRLEEALAKKRRTDTGDGFKWN